MDPEKLERYPASFFGKLLLPIFLLFASVPLFGQVHNSVHDTLRVKTVFDLANAVTWPHQERIDTFDLGVLSHDTGLYHEFQRRSDRGLHERPVKVHRFDSIPQLGNLQLELLFLQQRGNWDITSVKKRIQGDSTLLFAENYPFYQSMISFIFEEGGTRYLVFRKPFLEKGFSYHKGLESLAIIKTQADWKRAYKHTENRLGKRKQELREKEKELEKQKKALRELEGQVEAKKEQLEEQREKLERKKDSLGTLKRSMRKRERELAEKRKHLEEKAKELKETRKAVQEQRKILSEQKEAADSLQAHVSEQKQRIEEQKGTLEAQDRRITYQTYALLAFGALILTILGFGYLLIRNYKRIKAINQELAEKNATILEQNERIEEKNKEITESITYASKIQHAMLPSLNILQDRFRDSSTLYIPRDIVSGDFYWAARTDERIVWTAADCTGHGVPGAMMSMLGMAYLKEVVVRKGISDPERVLEEVRDMIVKALSSEEEGSKAKDGMDMGLCTLDQEKKRLGFAGANNPLYLFYGPEGKEGRKFPEASKAILDEDGNERGVEIKADKQPVGAQGEELAPFHGHWMEVRSGDRVYLFSDGYPDQFGGEKGKKLKYKPFKQMILRSSDRSLPEQRDHLKEEFNEWKGNYEQVDDVVVLAVEI